MTPLMRAFTRFLLSAIFLTAALFHFLNARLFLPIMPPQITYPIGCILLSGVAEFAGAIGLLIPLKRVQILTGWGLTLLLIAVFPANIYMAAAHIKIHGFPSHEWMAWARLPLQPLFIIAVLWVTGIWSGNCKGKQNAINAHPDLNR